jgi:hypothetical protein
MMARLDEPVMKQVVKVILKNSVFPPARNVYRKRELHVDDGNKKKKILLQQLIDDPRHIRLRWSRYLPAGI